MSLTIDNLYKARDFVSLKNISGTHLELSFKNPIVAMLAKGKIAEIAEQCGPNAPFKSCELNGTDLKLAYDPEVMDERLLAEIFDSTDERAKEAAKELSEYVALKLKA